MFITIVQLLLCLYCIYKILRITVTIFSQRRNQYQETLNDIKRNQKQISTMIAIREETILDIVVLISNMISPTVYAIFSIFAASTCPDADITIFLWIEASLFLAEIVFYIAFKKANYTVNSFIMISDKIVNIIRGLASASILMTLVPYLTTLI